MEAVTIFSNEMKKMMESLSRSTRSVTNAHKSRFVSYTTFIWTPMGFEICESATLRSRSDAAGTVFRMCNLTM